MRAIFKRIGQKTQAVADSSDVYLRPTPDGKSEISFFEGCQVEIDDFLQLFQKNGIKGTI